MTIFLAPSKGITSDDSDPSGKVDYHTVLKNPQPFDYWMKVKEIRNGQ